MKQRRHPLTSRSEPVRQIVAMAGKGDRVKKRLLVNELCLAVGKVSLALEAGKANPAPPVGPALGAKASTSKKFSC